MLAYVEKIIVALGERLKVFSDILSAGYFFRDELVYDEKMFDKRVRKEGVSAHLAAFRQRLADLETFTVPAIEAALVDYCRESGEQTGTLIHALRLSTTGQPVGPGVYDCLALLSQGATRTVPDTHLHVERSSRLRSNLRPSPPPAKIHPKFPTQKKFPPNAPPNPRIHQIKHETKLRFRRFCGCVFAANLE